MEKSNSKNRTPSRCREWERNRRNKFNHAISRLGEIVKEVNKSNNQSKDGENVQYPKVEIVEKAIVCLKSFVQEKTQLKAELLALQVKLDTDKKSKEGTKDASTQVYIGIRNKRKNDKYMKVLMLPKKNRKALKEKSILTVNATVEAKTSNNNSYSKESTQSSRTKLPTLLPKSNLNNRTGPEGTIVVLPAAPYIFPQRPLILPTVPPAFVFLDSNMQNLNKQTLPVINRTNSETTKTTMVNILPISAYSHPLSASKAKKSGKNKVETKKNKKPKQIIKLKNHSDKIVNNLTDIATSTNLENMNIKESINENILKSQPELNPMETTPVSEAKSVKEMNVTVPIKEITTTRTILPAPETSDKIQTTSVEIEKEIAEDISQPKCTENSVISKTEKSEISLNEDDKSKSIKTVHEKELVEKEKENKLPNILDSALCENTVDTGNARLELAEEFLAASPTAAFLMSFPLVSGNRADSPAEDTTNSIPVNPKDTQNNTQRRSDINVNPHTIPYFEKPNPGNMKEKQIVKPHTGLNNASTMTKQVALPKFVETNVNSKQDATKTSNTTVATNSAIDNPFLNLPMSSLLSTTSTLPETNFNLDFECHIGKSLPSQSSSYVNNSNIFYKSDPFSSVKSTIYSTSNISSGHEFNSFGLYPCAMEKYSTKNKTDYTNVEDNIMKIGSSRLTYDIDLGWSHKSFDFVSCTNTPNTFNKDSILTSTSGTYSTSYNPFNPEFHVPLVTNTNKKDIATSKPNTSFSDTISNFYSQPTNLWSEDVPFYNNNSNIPKTLSSRQQNYLQHDHSQTNVKSSGPKHFESKPVSEGVINNISKPINTVAAQQNIPVEKYTKKSSSKMHINWMTSEVRPMQSNCDSTHLPVKESAKPSYISIDHTTKKQDQENNYFPISMHNFSAQSVQDEMQVWPTARPAGPMEISIEPPPINLPTLVGDLALGPHDKKKSDVSSNRSGPQTDIQNCTNYFSVTHLMNRSSENTAPSRYLNNNNIDAQKSLTSKQNITHTANDINRKVMSRTESQNIPQPCYGFNNTKSTNSYDNMTQFAQSKLKTNKSDKSSKAQKNSYSAESLLRGNTCNPKLQDNNSAKFMIPAQKYNEFNPSQDNTVAQVSHFPPILDYSDNTYTGQQFSGTNLYNTTTNTISNSFYSNFMPGSSNLMSGNYTGGPFAGDFIDYNQTPDCNYPNTKYTDLKMRNNSTMYNQEKVLTGYKSSRRESAAKHKLECSKKESNKKCQNKRAKLNNEGEEWNDTAHLLWQNKAPAKRHGNLMSEELPFPNYVGNQMGGQYQSDFFNSHIMTPNMQSVGHNVDRTLTSFPVTSRANFNLSTIFPEITMKVQ